MDSSNVLVYGTGLYSFFENYNQDCVAKNNCQQNMIGISGKLDNVHLYNVNTKASVNMVTLNGWGTAQDKDNRNNFCATLMHWTI